MTSVWDLPGRLHPEFERTTAELPAWSRRLSTGDTMTAQAVLYAPSSGIVFVTVRCHDVRRVRDAIYGPRDGFDAFRVRPKGLAFARLEGGTVAREVVEFTSKLPEEAVVLSWPLTFSTVGALLEEPGGQVLFEAERAAKLRARELEAGGAHDAVAIRAARARRCELVEVLPDAMTWDLPEVRGTRPRPAERVTLVVLGFHLEGVGRHMLSLPLKRTALGWSTTREVFLWWGDRGIAELARDAAAVGQLELPGLVVPAGGLRP